MRIGLCPCRVGLKDAAGDGADTEKEREQGVLLLARTCSSFGRKKEKDRKAKIKKKKKRREVIYVWEVRRNPADRRLPVSLPYLFLSFSIPLVFKFHLTVC